MKKLTAILLFLQICISSFAQHTLTVGVMPKGTGTVNVSEQTLRSAGEVVTLIATPAANCSFLYWAEGETILSEYANYRYVMPDRDVTLTAYFDYSPADPADPPLTPEYGMHTLVVQVTPKGTGSLNIEELSLHYANEEVELTATPAKNCSFLYWAEGETILSENANYRYVMPDKDVILTAHFDYSPDEPDDPPVTPGYGKYSVTYLVDGEVYETDTCVYGAVISPIDEPTKEGYTFSGWSEIPETMPANDIVITGSFTVNSYIVTYIVDGEPYYEERYDYGTPIYPLQVPDRVGEVFSGWIDVPATMPAQDIVVWGTFTVIFTSQMVSSPYGYKWLECHLYQPGLLGQAIASSGTTDFERIVLNGELNNEDLATLESIAPQLTAVKSNTPTTLRNALRTANPNLLYYCSDRSLAPAHLTNIIVDGVAERITLATDGGNFCCPEPFTARRISYEREFRMHTGIGQAEGWESLLLPYDVQKIYHIDLYEHIYPIATRQEGVYDYYFWLFDRENGTWNPATSIRANIPYIISMPNNEAYVADCRLPGRVSFRAENATVPITPQDNGQQANALQGTTRRVAATDGVYVLNANRDYNGLLQGSTFVRAEWDAMPFEAYITGVDSQVKMLCIDELGALTGNEANAISTVTGTGRNDIYTLSGMKVGVQDVRQLPAGLYIRNGKKVRVAR